MGQSASLDSPSSASVVGRDDFTDELDFLHEQIRKHSLTLRQLTLLTNEDFHRKINELNALSSKFVDCNSKQLLFEVKPGTDRNMLLWKGLVRIKCVKLDSITQKVEKSRELSLKQFLQVYNTLQQHLSVSSDLVVQEEEEDETEEPEDDICSSHDHEDEACCSSSRSSSSAHKISSKKKKTPAKISMNASMFLDNVGKVVEFDHHHVSDKQLPVPKLSDDECCCICMDSKRQVSLPCAHSYCLACIEQWNVDHKTCPICRETLETTDDTWVLEDRPNSEDVSMEIRKSLFELTK